MGERFVLEGCTYYQEFRKCGREGCRCNKGGPPHGPYWWMRNPYGKRKYLGKELPAEVLRAKEVRERLYAELWIGEEEERVAAEYRALTRLRRNEVLGDKDCEVLEGLGLGNALVHRSTR